MESAPRFAVTDRRVYPAPAARVFEAWTNPRLLERWIWGSLGREERAEVDPRVGGQYRVTTKAKDGQAFALFGEYLRIEPGKRIVCSLGWDAPMGYDPAPEQLTIELTPIDGGTEVRFEHAGIPLEAAQAEHERGWRDVFARLATVLTDEGGAGSPRI